MSALIFYLLGAFALVVPNPGALNLPSDFQHKVSAHLPGVTEQHQNSNSGETVDQIIVDTSSVLPGDMVHLLYGMARKYWLEHQIYPVHSACVGNSKLGYSLIIGENGAGKTTTALNLIANHEAKLFSGDKTLVKIDEEGKLFAIAGTKIMTTRLDTHIGPFEKVIRKEDLTSTDRNSFQLQDRYVETQSMIEIQRIYLIKAYHEVERNEELQFPVNLFVLYPHFIDEERADVILGSGQRIFNGEISGENKAKNLAQIVKVMKQVRVRNITGSLEYVTSEIAKDMEAK